MFLNLDQITTVQGYFDPMDAVDHEWLSGDYIEFVQPQEAFENPLVVDDTHGYWFVLGRKGGVSFDWADAEHEDMTQEVLDDLKVYGPKYDQEWVRTQRAKRD